MNCLKLFSVALLMFVIHKSQPWPLPEKSAARIKENSGLQPKQDPGRTRRSIPEFDAVNPAYFDMESQPDQELAVDPQGDLSPFSLVDHVGNLFRSQKPVKQEHKSLARPAQGLRALNLARDEESVDSGRLPTDEQEECYRQQNIDPPQSSGPSAKGMVDRHGPLAMSAVGVRHGPAYGDDNHEVHEGGEGSKYNEEQDNYLREKEEISSLYSDPEQVIRLKAKNKKSERIPDSHEVNEVKIFKPVNVQAKFPVYDEDIDFVPDPLQGILEDKYWLDPADQEAVIRKYIDLAANNMMLEGTEYGKRSAEQSDNKIKSVDSKAGFQNIERQCPCQEVSSCGECSKGKGQKKSNITEISDADVSYGRKLLALDLKPEYEPDDLSFRKRAEENNQDELIEGVDGFGFLNDKEYSNFERIESSVDGEFPALAKYVGRKLLSLEWNEEENNDDELVSGLTDYVSSNLASNTHVEPPKPILAYKQYDGNDESYNDDEYDTQVSDNENSPSIGEETSENEMERKRDVLQSNEPHYFLESSSIKDPGVKSTKQETDRSFIAVNSYTHNSPEVLSSYYEPNKLANMLQNPFHGKAKEIINNITGFEVVSKQAKSNENANKPIFLTKVNTPCGLPNNPPAYYEPNKLANVLRKPFQEKPKGPPKSQINPSLEFQKLKHATIYNYSLEQKSESPSISSKQNSSTSLKARRSYSDTGYLNTPYELTQSQSLKNSSNSNNKERNKRTNSSMSANTSIIQTKTETNDSSGFLSFPTTLPVAKCSKNQTTSVTEIFKKIYEDDEIDAKVANSIVESVMKESQRSSAVGHNLGICRKNESVISMKYGKIIPEAEKVLKSVTNCILDKIKDHLSQQSCVLLDPEMLEFLKWMVLGGESYKDYMQKLGPEYFDFVPLPSGHSQNSFSSPSGQLGEQEPLVQNPNFAMSLMPNESGKHPALAK